jgi:hypothetical protein
MPAAPRPTTGPALVLDPANAPISGAIFTAIYNGPGTACTRVNANIYESKDLVGLNGGPRREGSAGLPPGTYYVQVTDPSGKTILGSSGDARPIVVNSQGEFAECYQLAAIVKSFSTGYTTSGYDDTPNNGDEYKVWVSSERDFRNSRTKTDNFKIRSGGGGGEFGTLTVDKFFDANGNGIQDGEPFINYWPMTITGITGITNPLLTPVSITGLEIQDPPATATVTEGVPSAGSWFISYANATINPAQALTSSSAAANAVTVEIKAGINSVVFGNYCTVGSGGNTLGFWSNQNGRLVLQNGRTVNGVTFLAADNAWRKIFNGYAYQTARGASFGISESGPFVSEMRNNVPTKGAYAEFRTWILGASSSTTATAGYMLSAQLAATVLNVAAGYVDANAYYTPAGMTIQELIDAANKALGATPQNRAHQLTLKDWLDELNNGAAVIPASPNSCPGVPTAPAE